MAANDKFYWVRLDYRRFESGKDLDFLMSQKNGAEYVVLYQMLCLNTRNSGGELVIKMNEMIVPFDVDRIVRDCKYFSRDTVIIALELYRKLGMIYEQENGIFRISNYEEMVGSETSAAKRMRDMRERNKASLPDNSNVTDSVTLLPESDKKVTTDIRDKSKDINIKQSSSLRSLDSSETAEKLAAPEVFTTLPLLGGQTACITFDYVNQMKECYPAVDIMAEIQKARGWLINNPKKQKKDWKRFLGNWFSKAQDRAYTIPSSRRFGGTSTPEEIQESLRNAKQNEDGSVNF